MSNHVRKQHSDVEAVVREIQRFTVETPSWGYGDSGTRFKVFHWPGAARNLREKLADGTNYPGQDDLLRRRHRLLESLQAIYVALPADMRLLIEYKFFEPSFYSTDLPDWGTSLLMAQKLGPQAEVLVDTGHHPQGTNIAQIVAQLLDEGRLGGFHFNDRRYADDDLIAGSQNPFELFCIFNEIVGAGSEGVANAGRIAYMIDQSHNIEPKIEAMIQSVLNIQTAYAKALLVDRDALREAQEVGDVLGAYRVLQAAYETDVRPLLAEVRTRQGRDPDPMAAFRASGYAERVARERAAGLTSSGYPGA